MIDILTDSSEQSFAPNALGRRSGERVRFAASNVGALIRSEQDAIDQRLAGSTDTQLSSQSHKPAEFILEGVH